MAKRVLGPSANATLRWIGSRLDNLSDARWGVETTGRIRTGELDVEGKHAKHLKGYEVSSPSLFKSAMKKIPKNYKDFVFIDVGSGKGKVLLLASRYAFSEIIGIEISKTLNNIAKQNLLAIDHRQKKRQKCSNISLLSDDAASYQFPLANIVLYLFNPFDDVILQKLLDSLKVVAASGQYKIHLIYCNAVHADTVQNSGIFTASSRIRAPFFIRRARSIPDVIVYSS